MTDRPNAQNADPNHKDVCECGDPRCNYVANLQAGMAWLKQAAANVKQGQR